jgi:hypothetical protein
VCYICHHQAVEEAIARMEYELTHESLSADREKMVREKKERAEKHDRPAAMRLAQVRPVTTSACEFTCPPVLLAHSFRHDRRWRLTPQQLAHSLCR